MAYRNYILCFVLLTSFLEGFTQERYIDAIFSQFNKETYTYSDTLQLDFYSSKSDTVANRPLLFLVHGGGFASGKRDNDLEQTFCEKMVKRGYAVASISYRLTRKGKSFGCDCPTKDKLETFLKASEDILNATRFLVDRSSSLKFDTNKIILVGSSAGAEGVLNTAFLQHHHDFSTLTYDNLKFSGVISFSGALLDARYITDENAIPSLLFHGKKDRLVPFGSAPHHFCDESSPGFLLLDGSQSIAKRLKHLDQAYTLAIDPEGNHDWANLSYSYIDIITHFIKKTIIDGEWQQSIIKVSPKN